VDGLFTLPDVTFTDTAGAKFRLREDTRDPVTLLFFGYTSCPDICNAVLADVAAALRRADPTVRESTRLVFVTTDPARDTGPAIRAYLDRFDPSYVGLRAPMPTVRRAAAELGGALTGKEKLPGGGYEVGHGTQVTAFGPDERSLVLWTPGTPVADLRHDLGLLTRTAQGAGATESPAR
jgi:protein SCO1/2